MCGDGFNGIVVIIWGGAFRLLMKCKLNVGVRFIGMWRNLKRIALWLILLVVHDKDKRCYSGRIIRLFDENLL